MLVLSRKRNESIVVGPSRDNIATIVVVDIRGDKVRLGIEVPNKDWVVHRLEVYEAIKRDEQMKADKKSSP